jgi:hypothetical protein
MTAIGQPHHSAGKERCGWGMGKVPKHGSRVGTELRRDGCTRLLSTPSLQPHLYHDIYPILRDIAF